MAVDKEQVLAALASVATPGGTPLPRTGTLSEVVAGDGKVFFSITVDAADVKSWEPVRKHAEEVVRALPGVRSALVALTAERTTSHCLPAPTLRTIRLAHSLLFAVARKSGLPTKPSSG